MLKEQLSAIRSAYDQEDAFAWLLTGFGKWIEYKRSPFLFHHKLNRLDGHASSVVLVVSPTKACILGRVGGRSKTTLFFYSLYTLYVAGRRGRGHGGGTGVVRLFIELY